MNALVELVAERRGELLLLTRQHLLLVLVATLLAAAAALPLGILMTRRPRLAGPLLGLAGIVQTLPSLALFGFLIPLPLLGGIGARSAVVALVLYALLPILRNTYAGIRQVDPAVREAALGLGMTDAQLLRLVELPLALPVILAGVRTATVISVGTATIAAAIGAGGLGTYIFRGLATLDTRLILLGAIPSAALALIADAFLGRLEHSRRPGRAAAALSLASAALALALGWPAASGAGLRPLAVVGSKNFTEQVVLGEILAATLEDAGFRVERRLNLGGTTLCHTAVASGQIDAYVEYTGTALKDVLKLPTISDPEEVFRLVREGYQALGLHVGAPLGFNNSFALVMRGDDARAGRVTRISDLRPLEASLRVGLFGEFLEREDGLRGLTRAYGLRLTLPPREMDLGLLYQALLARQVDLVVGSATDGLIAARDLVVLEDDRRFFPPYDAVVVANRARLRTEPLLGVALSRLEGRIDAAAMRRMNYAVDAEHRVPRSVARAFVDGLGTLP